MGVSYTVYIGPYIRCVNMEQTKSVENVGCESCRNQSQTNFCSDCGEKNTRYKESVVVSRVSIDDLESSFSEVGVDFYNTFSQLSDSYYDNTNIDIFVSNKRDEVGLRFNPTRNFGVLKSEVNTQDDINAMKKLFASDLPTFHRIYGKENVSIVWGVISYAS